MNNAILTDWHSTVTAQYIGYYSCRMIANTNEVYLYGNFVTLNQKNTRGFAIIADTNPVPAATPTPTITPTPLPNRADTIGAYKNGTFYLRNTNTTGNADITATFGGAALDLPVVGDWNGDGMDTIGVYRSDTAFFYLSDSNTAPSVAHTVLFGNPGDSPFAGRWTVDMDRDGVGVYRNSNGILYQKKALTTGFSDYFAVFGNPGDVAFAGDWNNDGVDSIGIFRTSDAKWYLSNNSTPDGITYADINVDWPVAGRTPFVGDWNGDGFTTIGRMSNTGRFVLHATLTTNSSDIILDFGPADSKPIAGKWTLPARPPTYAVINPVRPASNDNTDTSRSD